MNPTRRRFLQLGSLAGCSLMAGTGRGQTAGRDEAQARVAWLRAKAEKIRPIHEEKLPAQDGDWLASHSEPGQKFAPYLKSNPNRPTAERTRLYLLPLGEFSSEEEAVFQKTREYLGLVFGLDVKVLERIGLQGIASEARRQNPQTGKPQINSLHVLDKVMKRLRPRDAVATLALTPTDLWPGPGWNFVFGQASLEERVGVWSTARLGHPIKEAAIYLRRVLQVAAHETGHMFGIRHCTAYQCGMNGSNHLAESDRTPLWFCPECDPKLWWACGLNPAERAARLADFSAKIGLAAEAEHWRKEAKLLAE